MIPREANAGFVAAMEDVLETYQRPRDPDRPLVCLDETSKQLIVETRAPIPPKPGRLARHDYEYLRNGVANRLAGSRDRGEADRARAVLLTLAGWTSPKIAEAFGVREDTVRLWCSDLTAGAVAALKVSIARPGRLL